MGMRYPQTEGYQLQRRFRSHLEGVRRRADRDGEVQDPRAIYELLPEIIQEAMQGGPGPDRPGREPWSQARRPSGREDIFPRHDQA